MADGEVHLLEGGDVLGDLAALVEVVAADAVDGVDVSRISARAALQHGVGPARNRHSGRVGEDRRRQRAHLDGRQRFVQRTGGAAQHAEVAGGELKRDRQAVRFLAGVHPLDRVTGQQHGRFSRGVGAGEAGDLLGRDAAQRLGPPRRARLAAVPAQHIRLKLLEAGAVGRDEGAIDAVFRQQDMEHRQHQRGVGPGAAGDPPGAGLARRARAPRVNDHDLGAAAGGFEQAGVDVRAQARFQHVGAPQHDHLGILHRGGIETGGHPLLAEEIRQDELDRADAVGAGEAGGAAVEVQETPQQRDGAVERARAAGAGQVQHRSCAELRPDVPQPVGDQVQRLVPARLAEAAGAAAPVRISGRSTRSGA